MNFKLSTEPFIRFNPYDGYFVLRITDFKSAINLDREQFIKSLLKYVSKNWFLIEIFHKKFTFRKQVKRQDVNVLKWKIFKRDNFTCQKCGSQEVLELDHIIPFSKNGKDDESNYQTLCQPCNRKKKDRLI